MTTAARHCQDSEYEAAMTPEAAAEVLNCFEGTANAERIARVKRGNW